MPMYLVFEICPKLLGRLFDIGMVNDLLKRLFGN